MPIKRKTWKEKLEGCKNFPKIIKFDPKFPCGKALEKMGAKYGCSVVLAQGKEVDEIMKKVPKGKIITIKEICKKLAEKHKVDFCCTLTTGIFIMVSANAAEEEKIKGEKNITPYWRTLKMGGVLNEKFPGGAEKQKKILEDEGHKIIKKGKKYIVSNFEDYLAVL